VQEEDKKS